MKYRLVMFLVFCQFQVWLFPSAKPFGKNAVQGVSLSQAFFIPNILDVKTGDFLVDDKNVVAVMQNTQGRVLFTPSGAFIGIPVFDEPAVSLESRDPRKKLMTRHLSEGRFASRVVVLKCGFPTKLKTLSHPELREQSGGTVNFLIGGKANWKTDIPTFRKLVYPDVWQGIEFEYTGSNDHLEITVKIHPTGNPSEIMMDTGAKSLALPQSGELVAESEDVSCRMSSPTAWQEINGEKVAVPARYVTRENGQYGFQIQTYQNRYILYLSYSISWGTFLGGTGIDVGNGIAEDSTGNLYVVGITSSANFPTTPGAFDTTWAFSDEVFVTKLNATGTGLIFSTYIGGNYDDYGYSIAVDTAGNSFITGATESYDFPVTAGAYDTEFHFGSDVFVSKLNSLGNSLLYSTRIGGDWDDVGLCLRIDPSGNAFVTGRTSSSDFPVTPGAYQTVYHGDFLTSDAFMAKLNAAGTNLIYSSFYGQSTDDGANGLAVDSAGNACITGYTKLDKSGANQESEDRKYADFAPFVAKFNNTGCNLIFNYLLGNLSVDSSGYDIVVDSHGYFYMTGYYDESYGNILVTKLDPLGKVLYSVSIGGSIQDISNAITIDDDGNAYIVGDTWSDDFPTTPGAIKPSYTGDLDDIVFFVLDPTATKLLYSTYLGGDDTDMGFDICLSNVGEVFITGRTNSNDFPITAGSYDTSLSDAYLYDAFVLKLTMTPPKAPTDLRTMIISPTQVKLTWKDNSSDELSFYIERRTGSSGSWALINTVGENVTTYIDSGLISDTTYFYRVSAHGILDSTYSNESSATPPSLPQAPSDLTAITISSAQVNLSWQDNSQNESGFKVERSAGLTPSWKEIATLGANINVYQDTGLSPHITYSYRVRAFNEGGDSDYSNVASATTPYIPSPPSNLQASTTSVIQISLAWQDNSDNEQCFQIERKLGSGGVYAQISTVMTNVTTFQDTGLTSNTLYCYRVKASNEVGASDFSNEASAMTCFEPAVTAQPGDQTIGSGQTATLSVTAAGTPPLNYQWYQGASPDMTIPVSGATGSTYTTPALTASTAFWVRASNACGSADSSTAVVTVVLPPAAPKNLRATVMSATRVDLAWDDQSDTEAGFQVWRAAGNDWQQIGTSGANQTAYQDLTASAGITYCYAIRSYNVAGVSAADTNHVCLTPAALQPPAAPANLRATVASPTDLDLTWDDLSGNEAGFHVWRSADGGSWEIIGSTGFGQAAYHDGTVTMNGMFCYGIRSYNAAGESAGGSNTLCVSPGQVLKPAPPTNLSATASAASTSQIGLSWTDASMNETMFKIERKTVPGGTFAQIVTVAAGQSTYTDSGLAAGTAYAYRVRASNGYGDSDYSNEAAATTYLGPSITSQPESTEICSGRTAALAIVASGTPPLHYQWYRGESGSTAAPVGIDSNSFVTPALTATTDYWVKVTNHFGAAGSGTLTVTVIQPPNITGQPQSQYVHFDRTAVLYVIASGTAPLHYQWYKGVSGDMSSPAGTDSNSYTTPALTATASFWVKVSNTCGTASSSTAAAIAVSGPSAGDLHSVDTIAGNLRYIPSGTFTQGSPADEPCRHVDETRFHHTIVRNIAVMETEVTRKMWADLKAAQPSLPKDPSSGAGGTNQDPVQQVTWHEAVLFANLLSQKNGFAPCYYTDSSRSTPISSSNYIDNNAVYCDFAAGGYRLPSEGEWEYFCRAGTATPFSVEEPNYGSGNCATCYPSPLLSGLDSVAWWCGNFSNQTHPVGQKASNPWNLKDVHGDVYEWCWDWYGSYPADGQLDYTGLPSGTLHVIRGGAGNTFAQICRSAFRYWIPPGNRHDNVGFRLVRSLPGIVPESPSNLSARVATANRIDLSWSDNSNIETDFKIDRKTGSSGTYARIGVAGANATSFQDTGLVSFTLYCYRVKASNEVSESGYSNEACAKTCFKPSIITHPQSQSICIGQAVSFTVAADSASPLHYRWYQGESGNTAVPVGSDSSSFKPPVLTATTSYWVKVTNDCGSVNSNTATVIVSQPPDITGQPQTQYVHPDQTTVLNVTAAGTPPLHFQWYKGARGDQTAPVGTDSNIYTTPALAATTGFWAKVSNFCGSAYSEGAVLIVSPGPLPGDLCSADTLAGNLYYAPAGTFVQGSPESEPCRHSNENPPFTHTLTRNLAVMETEVTRQMWSGLRAVQPTLPEDPSASDPAPVMEYPVQQTTWYQTILFANLLSIQQGFTRCYYTDGSFTIPVTAANYTTGPFYCNWDADGFRLPSEGEWEHFCRAGTTGPFSIDEPNYTSGNCAGCSPNPVLTELDSAAWWCGNTSVRQPVGRKAANLWNLRDVHGNVMELCWDWGGAYPAGSVADYYGPAAGSVKIARGGGILYGSSGVRSAFRAGDAPGNYHGDQGFRLVRTVDIPPIAPAGLAAAAVSADRINLNWSDFSFDETGFRIERKTGPGGAWAQIAAAAAGVTAYPDTGLAAATLYVYRVRAVNAAGDSGYSNEALAATFNRSANFTIGGYLGAGTSAPERAVHIKGSNAVFRMDRSQDTAAFMIVRNDAAGQVLKTFVVGVNAAGWNNGSFVINDLGQTATGGGINRLTVDNSGNAIFGAEVRARGFVTTSSRRFKTDIRPLAGALDTLLRLRGVAFRWADTGAPAAGLIAEDAEEASPALVFRFGGSAAAGIRYDALAAMLVESIRSQQRQIEQLRMERERLRRLLEEWVERRKVKSSAPAAPAAER